MLVPSAPLKTFHFSKRTKPFWVAQPCPSLAAVLWQTQCYPATALAPSTGQLTPSSFQRAGSVWRTPAEKSRILTAHIVKCKRLSTLIRLCYGADVELNPIHINAALTTCVKIAQQQQQQRRTLVWNVGMPLQHSTADGLQCREGQAVPLRHQQHAEAAVQLQQLHEFISWALQCLLQQLHLCTAREISNVLWCCAKLQYKPAAGILDRLLSCFSDVLPSSSCQAISVVMQSLAKFNFLPSRGCLDQLLCRLVKATLQQAYKEGSIVAGPSGLHEQMQHHHQQGQQGGLRQQLQQQPQEQLKHGLQLEQQPQHWSRLQAYQQGTGLQRHLHPLEQPQGWPCQQELLTKQQPSMHRQQGLVVQQRQRVQGNHSHLLHFQLQQQRQQQHHISQGHIQQQLSPKHMHQQEAPSSIQALATAAWALARLQQQEVAEVWLLPLLSLLCHCLAAEGLGPATTRQQQQQQQDRGAAAIQPQQHQQRCYVLCSVQAAANMLWACGKLLPAFAQQQQQPSDQLYLEQGKSQSAIVAVARLKAAWLLESCTQQLSEARPQELVMFIWSCRKLELGPSPQWQQHFWQASVRALRGLDIHECANVLFDVAYLRLSPPPAWMAAVLAVCQASLGEASARDLARMVWAVGSLRMRPSLEWMLAVLAAFTSRIKQEPAAATPVAVSMLVWGMTKVGYQPPAAAADVLLQAVTNRLDEYKPHQLSKLLFSCSALRLQQLESLSASLLTSFCQQLQQCNAADVAMVLRALAGRQQRSSSGSSAVSCRTAAPGMSIKVNAAASHGSNVQLQSPPGVQQPPQLSTHSHSSGNSGWSGYGRHPSGVSPYTYAGSSSFSSGSYVLSRVGSRGDISSNSSGGSASSPEAVVQSFQLEAVLAHAEELLPHMTAVELTQSLYAAAQLGVAVSGRLWSQAVNQTLAQQMHLLMPGDVCLLLYALARLQHAVRVRDLLHRRILSHSGQLLLAGKFTPRDLTSFVWNYYRLFGRFQPVLPEKWIAAFTQAAGLQLQGFTGRQLGVLLKGLLLLRVVPDKGFVDTVAWFVELQSASYSKYEMAMTSSLLLQLQQQLLAARPHVQHRQ